jgi:acetyl-CoA synthetase
MNIADSCFQGKPDSLALREGREDGSWRDYSLAEFEALVDRHAWGLSRLGLRPGDRIGLVSAFTAEAAALFLGAVKAGVVPVTASDAFSGAELAVRMRIGGARYLFTQDCVMRNGRKLPLLDRAAAAGLPLVLRRFDAASVLPPGSIDWRDFLGDEIKPFAAVERQAEDELCLLFSSGTTGEPKGIPWRHSTAIKCASDGRFHQDIHPGDRVCWPTSLGWMMGPWLLFATLINRGCVVLPHGAPAGEVFGRFIEKSGTTILGLVPSMVAAWRSQGCLGSCDWSGIRLFSSTGECSNPGDMAWLMAFAGGRPVIEYCGGTEIGGAYITGSLCLPCRAGYCNTPALGSGLVLLDETGTEAEEGEIFLRPPAFGLSTRLLNADHHQVYFSGCPEFEGRLLRRHGDLARRCEKGWRLLGRGDDRMKLGGIMVSSGEIEEVLRGLTWVGDCAAVAVPPPGGGPLSLWIAWVPSGEVVPPEAECLEAFRRLVKDRLNPLFKVAGSRRLESLPRTASNKVMRRLLRQGFESQP